MRRWTLNTLTVLSLVLCVGAVALYLGSYHRKVTIARSLRRGSAEVSLYVYRGRVVVDNAPDVARDDDRQNQLMAAIERQATTFTDAQLAVTDAWRSRLSSNLRVNDDGIRIAKFSSHPTDHELLPGELDWLRASRRDLDLAIAARVTFRPTTPWLIEYSTILPLSIAAFAMMPLLRWRLIRQIATRRRRQI